MKFMMLWRFLPLVLLGQLGLVYGQSSASSPAQLIAALPSCAVSLLSTRPAHEAARQTDISQSRPVS